MSASPVMMRKRSFPDICLYYELRPISCAAPMCGTVVGKYNNLIPSIITVVEETENWPYD